MAKLVRVFSLSFFFLLLCLFWIIFCFVFILLLATFAAYCLLMLMKNISNCARIRMLRLLPRQELKLELLLLRLLNNKWHKSEAKAFIMSMERRRLIFSWRFNGPNKSNSHSNNINNNYNNNSNYDKPKRFPELHNEFSLRSQRREIMASILGLRLYILINRKLKL